MEIREEKKAIVYFTPVGEEKTIASPQSRMLERKCKKEGGSSRSSCEKSRERKLILRAHRGGGMRGEQEAC